MVAQLRNANDNFQSGVQLFEQKKYKEALRFFNAACNARDGQDNPEIYSYRGATFFKLGQDGSALASYNHAIALDPANPKYHLHKGIVLTQTGQLQAAWESASWAEGLAEDMGDELDEAFFTTLQQVKLNLAKLKLQEQEHVPGAHHT